MRFLGQEHGESAGEWFAETGVRRNQWQQMLEHAGFAAWPSEQGFGSITHLPDWFHGRRAAATGRKGQRGLEGRATRKGSYPEVS